LAVAGCCGGADVAACCSGPQFERNQTPAWGSEPQPEKQWPHRPSHADGAGGPRARKGKVAGRSRRRPACLPRGRIDHAEGQALRHFLDSGGVAKRRVNGHVGGLPKLADDNNNTQYYQIIGATGTFIQNAAGVNLASGLAGFTVDNAPYPASGCSDAATPGNCITDAQIQAEIHGVIALKGWTGGPNKLFLLYTSSGEGSCFDSAGTSCAYTQYCAYHGFIPTSPPIIYANMPFGNLSACQVPGTPSPNGNAVADAVTDVASHEITEAITDPMLNAWFDSSGNEIADICNFDYGANTWDGGLANQQWNGHFYEVQQMFDNHAGGCVQLGP
jgi:hypothetical protein